MTEALPNRVEKRVATAVFAALLLAHLGLVSVGWQDQRMAGNEFRQVQTAITALFAQREGCQINYPMPLLGPPWSAPLEFPFYQWSVAQFSTATGWRIVQAGRAVSLLFFYASLPAMWLLLRRAGLPNWQRLLGIGLVLASPVYIFYSRGVTIEPAALLLSVWFLAALAEAVAQDRCHWLGLAIVAGMAAGLAKITTWMLFLIPVAAWLLVTAFRAVREQEPWSGMRWRRIVTVGAALVLPCLTAVGWVRFTDAIKADHPGSAGLVSTVMTGHNFGSLDVRLSARFWRELTHMWTLSAGPPILFVLLCIAAWWAGRWRPLAFTCLAIFFAAPMIFPILYSWHDYYFYANTVFLAAGSGFVFAGLRERWSSPIPAWSFLFVCLGIQGSAYFTQVYPDQKLITPGGSGLTFAIRDLTAEDDVIVIAGQDWHGFTPFYSERRAFMIRRDEEHTWEPIKTAFAQLRDDFVALVILVGPQRENRELLQLAVERLGIDPRPFAIFRDSVVYANRAVRWDYLAQLNGADYPELKPAEGVIHPDKPNEGRVRGNQMNVLLSGMKPKPHRYRVPYSIARYPAEGRRPLTAHATTSLWFKVPPGERRARVEFGLMEGSYTKGQGPTDGISLDLVEQLADGTEELRYRRTIDPLNRPEDRGMQTIDTTIQVAPRSELIVRVSPGPHGSDSFDWAYINRVVIE